MHQSLDDILRSADRSGAIHIHSLQVSEADLETLLRMGQDGRIRLLTVDYDLPQEDTRYLVGSTEPLRG